MSTDDLSEIRTHLGFNSESRVQQGLAMLNTLSRSQLRSLAETVTTDPYGNLEANGGLLSSSAPRNRGFTALSLLQASGRLDEEIAVLRLTRWTRCDDLSPLTGAKALESLTLDLDRDLTAADLGVLSSLPNLKQLVLKKPGPLVDAAWVARLGGLVALELGDAVALDDLSPLSALTGLRRLRLAGIPVSSDLSVVSGMRGLTTLQFSFSRAEGDVGLPDLSPLSGLSALHTLELRNTAEPDLSPLAPLTGLRSLNLGSARLADLSGLAPLTGLTDLSLEWCRKLSDLSALAGFSELQSLNLQFCPAVTSLAPLSGLRRLRELRLECCTSITDLGALSELSGLGEGISVDEQGRPVKDGRVLQGLPLLVALIAKGDHLAGVQQVTLSDLPMLRDVGFLARHPSLKLVELVGCPGVEDATPLALLPALTDLNLTKCTALRPRPARSFLSGREAVEAYQRKLARALSRKKGRSAEDNERLAKMKAAGLLSKKKAASPTSGASATTVRQLLTAGDLSQVLQGLELLRAVGGRLAETFSEGLSVGPEGHLRIEAAAARRAHLRDHARRGFVALGCLRAAGKLDDVTAIMASNTTGYIPDLSPVEGLSGLTVLHIELDASLQSLSGLSGLTGLRSLKLSGGQITDLSPLSGLTGLEQLELYGMQVSDLGALSGLRALTHLRIGGSPTLTDISALGHLDRLRTLELERNSVLTDVTPVQSCAALEELTVRFPAMAVLPPLSGPRTLKTLTIEYGEVLTRVEDLSALTALSHLTLGHCGALVEIPGLARLPALEALSLFAAKALVRLPDLSGLTALESIQLGHCDRLEDVSGLRGVTSLKKAFLYHCASLRSVAVLAELPALEQAHIYGSPMIPEPERRLYT